MRKRNVHIQFWLNRKEAEALDKKVRRSGLSREKRIPEDPQIFRNSNIKIMFPLNMARVQRRPFKIVFVKL